MTVLRLSMGPTAN